MNSNSQINAKNKSKSKIKPIDAIQSTDTLSTILYLVRFYFTPFLFRRVSLSLEINALDLERNEVFSPL